MSVKWLDSPSRRPIHPSGGRYALGPPVTPTSATHPEVPAVRVPTAAADADEAAVGDAERITQISEPPTPVSGVEHHLLMRLDGVDAGSVAKLEGDSFGVGRGAGNDLQLMEPGVSRTHARIVRRGGCHVVEDLESRNGTFVRGEAVKHAVLRDGDLVQFGSHVCFRYTRTDGMHEQVLRQLFESGTRDALTGALNRRHFNERLSAELAYAARHGSELSLLIFDIDFFKRINDAHGHLAGDAVLRHVALVTARQVRNEDVFARYGGEEFAILLRGIGLSGALRVAERIRATLEALPTGFDGKLICATTSTGCAALSECGRHDPTELVELADRRLYVAKERGRNRVIGT